MDRPASATSSPPSAAADDPFIRVRGARDHNLQRVDVDIPRNAFVAFTGVSGSGKSSLAFGTIYAEAQRRYLESVAPYVRRLIRQVGAPKIDEISGLPPAVALQQQRGVANARSSVGTLTGLSNALRMLFSRAGKYPSNVTERFDAQDFSPNTERGACPECHGLGEVHTVTERSLVPYPALSIREGAIAAWPGAWQGKNLRDIAIALGYDVDKPWHKLPKSKRDWLLFTEQQPVVAVEPGEDRNEGYYNGKFVSAKRHVMQTLAQSKSEAMRERALRFVVTAPCPLCAGRKLRKEVLAVRFAGRDIAEMNAMTLERLAALFRPIANDAAADGGEVAATIARDLVSRIEVLLELGLGYLSVDRSSVSLSPGETQRVRVASQLRSGLFGVVYVLDEPSAGLHPADARPLLDVLARLKDAGNSLLVVEHDMDVVRRADWIVDVGPGAGEGGGRVLYSGPVSGLRTIDESRTRPFLFDRPRSPLRAPRTPKGWLRLSSITRHNLSNIEVAFPLGAMTAVTGVSGSGKSTLVSQVLTHLVSAQLGSQPAADGGGVIDGVASIERLVQVDQKPIGRTPRSNLATYTGLFDAVRALFAQTRDARRRRWSASRFSFNVAEGRCEVCRGEGFVAVELMFLPGTYSACPTCHGGRYNPRTLEISYRGKNIAEVLQLTVEQAGDFFSDQPSVSRSLSTLREVGLGYLRLGQPATELSGGEAQRIKLATELQRAQRGHTLYVLDEPTTSLHPADIELLLQQLQRLVDAGHSVIVVEHEMGVVAAADWVIDLGPGGGDAGGRVVAVGTPHEVARVAASKTAPHLARRLGS
ncbi:MAG TPA: excinuclease ABC subunit UvrA [Polyangiales bacterium]|nr:excinuclease ABC subunit UvrA [Polyangiales bacterium]